jgi:photosystem II stability/assembly factor-like uncharacterized protein
MIRIASLCLVVALFCVQNQSISQCEWQAQWESTDGRITSAICFVDSLHGWVGRNPLVRDALLRTTNGGATWDTINFPFDVGSVASVSFTDTLIGWVCDVSLSKIYKTSDGGMSWTTVYKTLNHHLFPQIIHFIDTLNGYGVGPDSAWSVTRIWKTTDGGISWSSQTVPGSVYYHMQFIDAARGWIIGGGIYATTDSGASWQQQTYPPSAGELYGLSFISASVGWVCSKLESWVLHTTDGGNSWNIQAFIEPSPYTHSFRQISFSDNMNGWIFGTTFYNHDLGAEVLRTTDGGISWNLESVGLARSFVNGIAIDECHVWGISNLDGVILGRDAPPEVEQPDIIVPVTLDLSQNYPNPFNPSTEIIFSLSHRERLTIRIYDTTGKVISTLIDEMKAPGSYSVMFNAGNLASGTYFFQLNTESAKVVRKAVLIR